MKKQASKKPTHRIRFWRNGMNEWNWRVVAANGNVIAYSNQGHERRIDSRAAVRNFLKAVRDNTVEVK